MEYIQERDVVLALRDGSLEALGAAYDRFQRLVYRTALGITGDPDAAADVLQDVFLRLYRFAYRLDPERPLQPWLYRMTANLSHTWVRHHNRWIRPLEDVLEWLVGSRKDTPLQQIEQKDAWSHVQSALLSLPLTHREVVVLYYLNDLSLQEISTILEVPVGTVKSRLHYARQALKERLGLLQKDNLPDIKYEFT